MLTNRDDFLRPRELKRKQVEIEKLGSVLIQEMSQSEGARFEGFIQRKGITESDHKLKLITLCVVNEDGETILTENDFPALLKLPATAINLLSYEIMVLNGFLKDNITLDDFKKNEAALQTTPED